MTRGTVALAALLALLLAGQAAAQIYPYVPFWDIKPSRNVNGVMRYRIYLNGRSYCFPDTRGYLVAPFCQKYVVGRANTLAEAEQLAAAAVQPAGRRLLAAGERNSTKKASSKKPKKDKKKTDDQLTDEDRAIGAASYGGHDDWYNDDTGDWYFGNTGGFYSYVPRPLLNTWVTYDFGMWDLWNAAPLNPDGSAWGIPLDVQSVGRNNICYDTFLTSSRFSDAVFMGAPGADRFVLENVDGFAWQLRLRSRKREIEGNPKMYLGASIWCKPFPGADFQDSCLGFYDKEDTEAVTTWFLSPVSPCRYHNQTCGNTVQCCGEPNMQCVGNFGSKICARRPGPPGLSSVTEQYDSTQPGGLIITVTLTAPADNGAAVVNKYEVWATNEAGTKIGPMSSSTPTVLFTSEDWGVLCGHIWTFSARAYNQVGASGLARFTSAPFAAASCDGGCTVIGGFCATRDTCCVNAEDRTGTVQCLESFCTQPPAEPTAVKGPTGGADGANVKIATTVGTPLTYGLPVTSYCFEAYADPELSDFRMISGCNTEPLIVVTSAGLSNALVMCTGEAITWHGMRVNVTTAAGTSWSSVIEDEVTTPACDPRTCQPILSPCTATAECCTTDPKRTGDVQCLADPTNVQICTQPAVAPTLVAGPTADAQGDDVTLTITMNATDTFGLDVRQYWFSATAESGTTEGTVLSGFNEFDPTVLFSTTEATFRAIMCTGNAITWNNMQIWVVTDAGEGLRTKISGTVTTAACTV